MASIALDTGVRAPEHSGRGSGELIDARALAADLEKFAAQHRGDERDLREQVAQRLKTALGDGTAKAEKLLDYAPTMPFAQGVAEQVAWLKSQG